MVGKLFGGFSGVNKNANAGYQVVMGDIVIQGNADQKTVSEIRRAQRENLKELLNEINKLK